MNKRTRNILIIVGALVVVVLLSVVAAKRGGSSATPVKVYAIAYTEFSVKLPENGVVQRPGMATIPTLVSGNIGRILAKPGDTVYAGQLLATIDNPALTYAAQGSAADYNSSSASITTARINSQNAQVQYEATVATSKSNLDQARRVYQADLSLLAQKAIARQVVDADKAKLDQAQVGYDQAVEQLKLGAVSGYGQNSVQTAEALAEKARIANNQNQQQVAFTHITAPYSGVIQTVAAQPADPLRSLQPGDAVSAGQSLFTLASSSGFIVKAQVDEQDIINVKLGQRVNVTGQDFPGKTIRGHVSSIAPDAQKSTDASSTAKQVLTTIALDSTPDFLRDGMTADIDILTTDIPHAIAVPNGAVVKEKSKSYVFVIKDGVAKKTEIQVGRVGDTQSMVKSGLVPGNVIAATANIVTDGMKVTPAPSVSPSPSSSP
jgi:HlyD family secretion protein